MKPLKIESIDLEITTNCNLACPYCYIGIAKLKGCGNVGRMSKELIEKVFDLIEKFGYPKKIKENGKDKVTQISFYGGEPLVDFDLVKYFVERSRERGMELRFSILSNGTQGTEEQVKWLKDNKIWIQRSIDGCPEVQEKYRPNSIEPYLEKSKIFNDYKDSRRMTVQPEFAKDIMKSLHWFESVGYKAGISPMPNFYTEWSDEQMNDFVKSLWDLGKYYVEQWKKGEAFYCYYFSREMANRFMSPEGRGDWGCGGARGLHCVSWNGGIYMCHRFSKVNKDSPFYFGTVDEALDGTAKGFSDFIYEHIEKFNKGRVTWPEECKTCIGQYGCEKGCMHTDWECTGTLIKHPKLYCMLRRESAKIVSWIDSQLRGLDPDWWTQGNSLSGVKNYEKNLSSDIIGKRIELATKKLIEKTKNKQIVNNSNKKIIERPNGATQKWCQEYATGCVETWK